jgi:hypothetical protein
MPEKFHVTTKGLPNLVASNYSGYPKYVVAASVENKAETESVVVSRPLIGFFPKRIPFAAVKHNSGTLFCSALTIYENGTRVDLSFDGKQIPKA